MNLSSAIRGIRGTLHYLSAGPAPNEKQLIEAMSECIADVVDPAECEVTTDGKTIALVGANRLQGNMASIMPFFILRAPLPADQRLKMAFEALAKSTQSFLTPCGGPAWPAPDVEPHVAVSSETINVWWGGSSEAEATVRLRPLDRSELGV
jgi:hypothetical protein